MYKIHRPVDSIAVRFEFRKVSKVRALVGTHDAQPTHDGVICVVFTINKVQYGPYSTNIKTFRRIWEGRLLTRGGPQESRELSKALGSYQAAIEATHEALVKADEAVDGQVIMNAMQGGISIGKSITLANVYEEFIKARKASVEHNRQRRSHDQISLATLESYPKRWAMIKLFLDKEKRSHFPVSAVDYGFTTRCKEFLVAYRRGNKANKPAYASATINKAISFLKMLITYAQSKGYVSSNRISTFACRGGSTANPKPLTVDQLDMLETCELPQKLRHACDSWLIAAELCLHYSDYSQLRSMRFITQPDGRRYIQHERSKQQGSSLKQTVDITPRAERLLAKYGGPRGLYYKSSAQFSAELKKIALHADLVDIHGVPIMLQFGQGRDSGLTQRARQGANGIQLSKMAGWANPRVANRYLGDDLGIVEGFARSISEVKPVPSSPNSECSQPFIHLHKSA